MSHLDWCSHSQCTLHQSRVLASQPTCAFSSASRCRVSARLVCRTSCSACRHGRRKGVLVGRCLVTRHSRCVRMRACRADAAIHITPQKATCNNPGHESAGGWLVAYGLSTQLAPSIHAQDAVLLSFTRISNAAHPSDAVHLLVTACLRRALVPLAAALLLLCSRARVGGAYAVKPAGQMLLHACNAALYVLVPGGEHG